ncbi:CrcB family protein [Cellulomonas sp. zg-Y908]|uniref:Fluoride-specific ion channel FluC n=1 Tax=Cellulomonas wangsupingiae TaxID=2968085 RepID=A0ABY5K4P1_9CELL|nr:CrcB family protein [Cellulomonas wangsupingiae]MCC2334912.1 CrcB family protein [Cellulomonas wangsupingiae]UUI65412.1 CrcB family protein [Cellulomonas wangsupingiae]
MIVLLALAGGLGAAARYVVDAAVVRRLPTSVPVGTAVVNVTACLLLGALTGWTLRGSGPDALHAVLGVGFLGGYSTFSTASVEAARLLLVGRGRAAVIHAVMMLLACLAAAVAGLALTGP